MSAPGESHESDLAVCGVGRLSNRSTALIRRRLLTIPDRHDWRGNRDGGVAQFFGTWKSGPDRLLRAIVGADGCHRTEACSYSGATGNGQNAPPNLDARQSPTFCSSSQ